MRRTIRPRHTSPPRTAPGGRATEAVISSRRLLRLGDRGPSSSRPLSYGFSSHVLGVGAGPSVLAASAGGVGVPPRIGAAGRSRVRPPPSHREALPAAASSSSGSQQGEARTTEPLTLSPPQREANVPVA
jgi:hypothetical protein